MGGQHGKSIRQKRAGGRARAGTCPPVRPSLIIKRRRLLLVIKRTDMERIVAKRYMRFPVTNEEVGHQRLWPVGVCEETQNYRALNRRAG